MRETFGRETDLTFRAFFHIGSLGCRLLSYNDESLKSDSWVLSIIFPKRLQN